MSDLDSTDSTDGTNSTYSAGAARPRAARPNDDVAEVDQTDPHAPLLTDHDIAERVGLLIGRACRRQLWLLFLDDRAVMLPTLMPNDELPAPLGDELAAAVAAMLRQAIAGTPIESVILVWERPGGPIAGEADTQSAAALGWACADAGVPVRAQLISHDFGVRLLGAEEFAPIVDAMAERTAG